MSNTFQETTKGEEQGQASCWYYHAVIIEKIGSLIVCAVQCPATASVPTAVVIFPSNQCPQQTIYTASVEWQCELSIAVYCVPSAHPPMWRLCYVSNTRVKAFCGQISICRHGVWVSPRNVL